MAHQAHNIPWNSVASRLKYSYQMRNARGQGSIPDPMDRKTDLVLIEKPDNDKVLMYFIKSIIRTLDEFVGTERLKYPPQAKLRPFFAHENIFDQVTTAAIRKASLDNEIPKIQSYMNQPGRSTEEARHDAIIDQNQMEVPTHIAAAVPDWRKYIIDVEGSNLNHWQGWVESTHTHEVGTTINTYTGQAAEHWGGYKMVSSKQERGDVATLCLYDNQILPLLRLARSPHHDLKELSYITGYSQMFNRPSGLKTILQAALTPYIVLNLLYCKPELYTTPAAERGTRDYRLCYSYRATVANCTCEDDHDYWAIPHRTFWGRGRYSLPGIDNRRQKPIMKNSVEVDPLGEGNAQELKEYLKECWSYLVRVEMVGREWDAKTELAIEITTVFECLGLIQWKDCERLWASQDWQDSFGAR